MPRLPDLLKTNYDWSLGNLHRLTPLQLCLAPFHDDYHPEFFPEVQSAFLLKQSAFLERRRTALRCFPPMMNLLQQLKAEGQPTPMRSVVAQRLIASFGSWGALGFGSWRDYADEAEDWGLVRLIPDDRGKNGARIEAIEGVTAPLKSPLSWRDHDLPLLWSVDPEKEHLSRAQVVGLPPHELVGLHMLLKNRTLAGHAREEFLTRRDEEDSKIRHAEERAWFDTIVPDESYGSYRSALRGYGLPPSTSNRPYSSSRYSPSLFSDSPYSDRRPSFLKPREPTSLPRSSVDRRPPAPSAPPSAPASPPTQSRTPPRTPPRNDTSSAPSQPRHQAEPAPGNLASSDPRPPKEASSQSATSPSAFPHLTTDKSLLPHHLTRQLRVLTTHCTSTDNSLSFLLPPLLPDAMVHRRSEGSLRVVELAYATFSQAMLALGEISKADTVERVELGDVEAGEWAWKDVLGTSEWGREAWEKEKGFGGGDGSESGRKREHEAEGGLTAAKRARAE